MEILQLHAGKVKFGVYFCHNFAHFRWEPIN